MNKRIKKLWIKALRSGKYKQAHHTLRDGSNDRCCLGVLCDVFKADAKRGRWIRNKDSKDWYFTVDGIEDSGVLPEPVWLWAKLPDDNPSLGTINTAASLNDEGKDFDYIANRIEKYL